MPKVVFYSDGDWSAVYIDGEKGDLLDQLEGA
jgi:hypothetical protein